MQRIPLLILAFIIMIVAVKAPASQETSLLDRHYQRCMGKEPCTVREGLRVLDELTEASRKALRHIAQACVETEYRNCFNPATNDVADWHKVHVQMNNIAKSLEARYALAKAKSSSLDRIEPSAGPNPYTNPDQEQLNENKQDWWQGGGWVPPQENNPYHKW
jgi:hypothetical protein